MKSRVLLSLLLLFAFKARADMPGNTPREAVHVLVRLGNLQGYTIYANGSYANYGEDDAVRDSADILLNGGYGAPPCVTFFGRDAGGRTTDSLFICNEEQGTVLLTLSVRDGRLQAVEDKGPAQQDEAPVINDDTDENKPETPVLALVLMALVSVSLLFAWYHVTQRKREAL